MSGSSGTDRIRVLLVPTGTANVASVAAALQRAGATVTMCQNAREIAAAERVVLPGVGSFDAAVAELRRRGWFEPLRQRLDVGLPTLGICLGMQLMLEVSDESVPPRSTRGLGVIGGAVERFASGPWRVPHMGWSAVRVPPDWCGASGGAVGERLADGQAYFAHSYIIPAVVPDASRWMVAESEYTGTRFAAMVRSRAFPGVMACQCHPELSGSWGAAVFAHWLGVSAGTGTSQRPASRSDVRIIPCMDVRDGRIVKGTRFANLRDAGDPAERARLYAAQGADELVMLDVSAGPEGRRACLETIRAIRASIDIPLCVGGGVRTAEDASAMLDAGADKIGVNSAAVRRPELIGELAERFGRQCVVAAIDAARRGQASPALQPAETDDDHSWEVVIASGTQRTGLDAIAWAGRVVELGAGEILLTSFDRDGTGEGYDIPLLAAIGRRVTVPVIASGGASRPEHLAVAVSQGGADAVLAATIFHDGLYTVSEARAALLAESTTRTNPAPRQESIA